jgi:dTDP-glucose 4,6-dehydratase
VASLSRNPAKSLAARPELGKLEGVEFLAGDVRTFKAEGRRFDFVLNAAADFLGPVEKEKPEELRSIIVDGARNMLAVARDCGAARLLQTSSGAVYGPANGGGIKEDAPLAPRGVYGFAKLEAERIVAGEAGAGLSCPIARCFAFAGPYMPFDAHFAFGNFVSDALAGRDIVVKGDGSPLRSFMYSAELALWLLRTLATGRHAEAYNVGSDEAVSVLDLAERIRSLSGTRGAVRVLGESQAGAGNAYVPDLSKAKRELGLKLKTGLDESIRRTLEWRRAEISG